MQLCTRAADIIMVFHHDSWDSTDWREEGEVLVKGKSVEGKERRGKEGTGTCNYVIEQPISHTTSSSLERLTSMHTSVPLPLFHPLSLFSPFSLPPRLPPSLLMQVLHNNDFLDERIPGTCT